MTRSEIKTGILGRVRNPAINLLMAAAAVFVAYSGVVMLETAADAVCPRPPFPGKTGLLFPPHSRSSYEMKDYACEEVINSLGFRDREVSLKKDTGVFRVAVIGDSFTYGWGVNIGDCWVKVAERLLREQGLAVEILNLGKPAAGPPQYAQIAETVLSKLQPDMIVIALLAGDDLQQTGSDPTPSEWFAGRFPTLTLMRRYWRQMLLGAPWPDPSPVIMTAEQARKWYREVAVDILKTMDPEMRARYDGLEDTVKRLFLDGLLNPWMIQHATGGPDYFLCTADPKSPELLEKTALLSGELKQAAKTAKRRGVPMVALSIPEGFYVNDTAHKNVQRIGFEMAPEMLMSKTADEAVHKAAKEAGLPSHDVSQGFRDRRADPGLYFEFDRHFTAAGNKLYGELVAPVLADEINRAKSQKQ